MTDYRPLISGAVARLECSTKESRRAIYERARNAQLAHLRRTPFTDSEIDRERIALEEAIHAVELQAAAKQTSTPPPYHALSKEAAPADKPRPASPSSRLARFAITDDQLRVILLVAAVILAYAAGVAGVLSFIKYTIY
jgi:hypothetical protein